MLVTGGAGFIGSHVVDALLARGERVTALDSFSDFLYPAARKERNLAAAYTQPGFQVVRCDITDAEAVRECFAATAPDAVIHLAGLAAVGPSVGNAERYARANVLGTINVLDNTRDHGVRNTVIASSSTVYGNAGGTPFHEDQPLHPLSPYGATKAAAEAIAESYTHLHEMPITALRFFNAYGPRVRPDLATYRFVAAVHHGTPIQLRGDGSVQRDYTYIADTVSGILAALANPDGYRVFNLGNEHPVAVRDLIQTVERAIGKSARIEPHPALAADLPFTCADNSRARVLLGYNPTTRLEEGIQLLYEWYLREDSADASPATG